MVYSNNMEQNDSKDTDYAGQMYVKKRSGELELVNFDKVNLRISWLNSHPTQLRVNAVFVSQKVILEIKNGIETKMLDEYACQVANDMGHIHPDYQILAARIAISNHQKNTSDCFSNAMDTCYRNKTHTGRPAPRINSLVYKFVQMHKDELNAMIVYERDFQFSYFGFFTLLDRYLLKRSGPRNLMAMRPQDYVIERPQDLWMRVACAIHMNRLDVKDKSVLPEIRELYDLLSQGYLMLATPALYNAGTECEQYVSCFLTAGHDSIDGIFDLNKNLAKISKHSGGVGFWWDLRSEGTDVKKTNGISGGMIPFLDILGKTAVAVDQGGKRKGSFAHYMEPMHPEFPKWLELKRPTGSGRIRELFYAIWAPDLWMKAVENDQLWYFFDPSEHPVLYSLWGKEYEAEYARLVAAKKYHGEPVKARMLWDEFIKTDVESGMPYLLFSDACNAKSNQKNLGKIRSSNLCTEVIEFSSPEEYACCVLGSMCLPKYVENKYDCKDCKEHTSECKSVPVFNHDKFALAVKVMVRVLNKIIDINFYPVEETRRSNKRHRPLSIGEQGLADAFKKMRMPFTSPEARKLNKEIHETMYFAALEASCELAKTLGPYSTFKAGSDPVFGKWEDSPMAKGQLQFDMWGVEEKSLSGRHNWQQLRKAIKEHGVRNSLLIGLMPTASTSQIQGNNECFEPYTSNMYVRRTLSGEHTMINHHLINDLIEHKLWNTDLRKQLIRDEGSVQALDIPKWMKDLHEIVWEMDSKTLIDMQADVAPFICQSMSANRWIKNPTLSRLSSMYFYAWKQGLKTGKYYLHSQSKSKAVAFGASAGDAVAKDKKEKPKKTFECKDEICTSCQG